MKITKSQLKQIIKEELDTALNEDKPFDASRQFKEHIKNAIKSSALGGPVDVLNDANVVAAIDELHDAVLAAAFEE